MEVFVPPIMLLGERLSASVSAAAGAGRLVYAPPQLWTVGLLHLGIRWSPLWVSVGCFLHVDVDCCLHVEVGEVILPMVALRLSLSYDEFVGLGVARPRVSVSACRVADDVPMRIPLGVAWGPCWHGPI